MLLIILAQCHPDGGAALEAGAECQLPYAVAPLHSLEGLHIRPGIPVQCTAAVRLDYISRMPSPSCIAVKGEPRRR